MPEDHLTALYGKLCRDPAINHMQLAFPIKSKTGAELWNANSNIIPSQNTKDFCLHRKKEIKYVGINRNKLVS